MTIRAYAEFDSDLPTDEIESDGDFIQYPGRSAAEAICGLLGDLGCAVEPLDYLHEKGWEFAFGYRSRRIVCRVTLIWRYLAIFDDRTGSKVVDHPEFVAIMERLADALAADSRFRGVGWFHEDEFEPHEAAAEAPDARRPAEGLPPPAPQFAREAWSDLSPYPFRRWVARLFDRYVVVGAPLAAAVAFLFAACMGNNILDSVDF